MLSALGSTIAPVLGGYRPGRPPVLPAKKQAPALPYRAGDAVMYVDEEGLMHAATLLSGPGKRKKKKKAPLVTIELLDSGSILQVPESTIALRAPGSKIGRALEAPERIIHASPVPHRLSGNTSLLDRPRTPQDVADRALSAIVGPDSPAT